jgi:BirA family biotin operon repressor/biotin-[acetyl-CoA-carboxylase] ligase
VDLADRLRERLASRGVAWASPIHHFPVLGSTNDRLKEEARAGAPEWTLVLADEQTAGRGRQGREWTSPRGNLYLSVLLRPAFGRPGLIPLMAAVAVAEALAEEGIEARVKWPNDVQAGGRKLAGILSESTSVSSAPLEWVVVGIGVNLVSAPAELAATATSVAAESGGQAPETVEAAAGILARLGVWYDSLSREGPSRLVAAWRTRSLPWWGEVVEALSGDQVLRGVARDVDEDGALVLEGENGSRVRLLSGEVRRLRLGVAE